MEEILITVDRRTELMGVLLKLSNYRDSGLLFDMELDNDVCEYPRNVLEYFAPFKNHRAVQLLNEIFARKLNFAYDAPVAFALNFDENYDFQGQENYPFADRLKKDPIFLELAKEMKNFAKDSNFNAFYDANMPFYDKATSEIKEKLSKFDLLNWMKDFYRLDLSSKKFVIDVLPLGKDSGFGPKINGAIYCCDSVRLLFDKSISFMRNPDHYLHEFSHSIVNPLTDKYLSQMDFEFSKEFTDKMRSQAYGPKSTNINESVIRAIQCVFLHDFCPIERVEQQIENTENLGFVFTRPLYEKLLEYKQDKSKNFDEAYLEICQIFKNFDKKLTENQKNL